MRRLAQFVRLFTSRVPNACVCVYVRRASVVLSRVCLASASVSRLAQFVRLFTSRVPNACVCVYVRRASVVLSRVCLASVCVCLASVSRLSRVCVHLSRVCLASVSRLCASGVGRRSSCLACVCPCECLRELAHFMRRSSFKEFKRFLLSSYYRCTYRLCRLYEQTFNILI